MTTLEDRLQDEAWMNANKILIGFLYTVMSNKQLISAFISKKKKKKKAQKLKYEIWQLQNFSSFNVHK
jgi:hypothetical protein